MRKTKKNEGHLVDQDKETNINAENQENIVPKTIMSGRKKLRINLVSSSCLQLYRSNSKNS